MARKPRDAEPEASWDLTALLKASAQPAHLAQRHLWLIRLLAWLRHNEAQEKASSAGPSAAPELTRVRHLLNVLDQNPAHRLTVQALLRDFWHDIDATTLLADYGFSPRMSLRSELWLRLTSRLLPATPDTRDLGALFDLLFKGDDDTWIEAIDTATLNRLADLLWPSALSAELTAQGQQVLLGSMSSLAAAIAAAGLSGPLRRRMDINLLADSPFHQLGAALERLRQAMQQNNHAASLREATYLRALLDACRRAADSVQDHLEEFGVSVDIVFECDQLRGRTLRLEALLDVALARDQALALHGVVVMLLRDFLQQRSLSALVQRHTQQLARRVAERNAEVGEHYITRTRREYLSMFTRALGGGIVVAGTTFVKFALAGLALLPFWDGMASGLNYAASFVLIMMLHLTLATKQPAMTAPALATKLAQSATPEGLNGFVDAVAQLIRSQVAGVFGNLAAVVPTVLLLQWACTAMMGSALVSEAATANTLHSLHALGPTALFAALTGVLLFLSSAVAGWAENWFVFRRLDSAIAWNPRIVANLGEARAQRWSLWWRKNISGVAGNVALGLMLGLVPVLLNFVGLGLEVRHVTLSAGLIAAAAGARGVAVVDDPALWWAVAAVPLIGLLNLVVSFSLAFMLAMRSRGIRLKDRRRINAAVRARFLRRPLSFVWPLKEDHLPPAPPPSPPSP